ncbi:hypothetical protein [Paludisphaera borealis]|uniref:Uncharacterized protein n=1 Tax=Paludisphaera borealis TaxID=1387353 RepID=A0A1U7CW87_9BACT|nr:hypothetical protein [Paludisphaera borealis]APW63195.1 hypothetical protein BSF38_04758 [Paludisphaera borealis]
MTDSPSGRRRPSIHITLARASRLHRLILFLGESPRTRDVVLSQLGIGLRTFYRELELLARCGVKVHHKGKQYTLMATVEQAEGRLPFPDPQLSFSEMAELARCDCESARRLSRLLTSVTSHPGPTPKKTPRAKKPK